MYYVSIQVVGPLGPNDSFTKADYQLLASVESSQYTQSLVELVNDLTIEGLDADNDTSSFRSELHMKLASLLLSQPKRRRLADLPTLKTEHRYIGSTIMVYAIAVTKLTFQHYHTFILDFKWRGFFFIASFRINRKICKE